MTVHNINFSSPAKLITSISPSFISKNGPFIAAYLGRIAYFLFSTQYWIAKKREFRKRSVPVEKVLPATNFIIEVSKK